MAQTFLDELFAKRGLPTVAGWCHQFMDQNIVKNITLSFYEIDPLTSRTEHYYNTRNNILYRRKIISRYYAVWESLSLV